jgi:hypothetical protein
MLPCHNSGHRDNSRARVASIRRMHAVADDDNNNSDGDLTCLRCDRADFDQSHDVVREYSHNDLSRT